MKECERLALKQTAGKHGTLQPARTARTEAAVREEITPN